eukprot:6018312-Pyramimonas_sp.AAC.1
MFMTIAVFAQSPFGLPCAVLSLWKLGFPETIVYTLKAYEAPKWDLARLGHLSNAAGMILHHTSSAYFITCASMKYNELDRYAVSMMAPIVLQHWIILVRHFHFPAYCALALGLEILWEFEVFSQAQFLEANF